MPKKNLGNIIDYVVKVKKITCHNKAKLDLLKVFNFEVGEENCILKRDKYSKKCI